MKNKILVLILFAISFVNAQTNDLAALADGKLTQFTPIKDYEKNSFYGYLALYEQGEVEKGKVKMEYLILDKNLNKVQKGNYTQIKKVSGFGDVVNTGVVKVKNALKLFYVRYRGTGVASAFSNITYLSLNSFREISLKENKVTEESYYNGEEFSKLNHLDKDLVSNYKKGDSEFVFGNIITETFSGIYVINSNKKLEKLDSETFCLYDTNQKKLWEFRYNEGTSKKHYRRLTYLKDLGNTLIFKVSVFKKNTRIEQRLLAVDIGSGKVKFDYLVEDKKSKVRHTYDYTINNDKVYITGNYYKSRGLGTYDIYESTEHLGVFRITLNMKGDVVDKKYFPWHEAAPFIKIKDEGQVDDDNYHLARKDEFIFEDGSISFLYEKYKPKKGDFTTYRTKEMVLMNFDLNFKMKSVDIIKKDKTRGFDQGDFLFSQYLNKRKDMVFFFQDKKKDEKTHDKNWVLGINKFISGKYSYEEIPISSKKDEFTVLPYYAKDGYILLREFNEKDDKYNQIRLEKLNL